MKEFIARLSWVDYLLFLAVIRGCYVGYKSGLFPEILRIISYLVTVIVAFNFYVPLGQFLTVNTFFNSETASAVSFFSLLATAFLVTKLVVWFFLKLLKIGEGGFVLRCLGMVLGACRWVIMLSLLFLLIGRTPLASLKSDIDKRSMVGPTVSSIAPMIFEALSTLSPQFDIQKAVS